MRKSYTLVKSSPCSNAIGVAQSVKIIKCDEIGGEHVELDELVHLLIVEGIEESGLEAGECIISRSEQERTTVKGQVPPPTTELKWWRNNGRA
ncbi:Fasciclin-like arabinogalactan protein 11 [Senna tora]|uniref:Fasciclin-like arabinogalactan protein 11 n=1 Tax=Senna tora TaxID=362788 RepID=A0A834TFV2_9FABA|nr:Fasciclin-like arabinogalactan protein 11 [Senna tora]